MRIIGECINGICNIIYVCFLFCWSVEVFELSKIEDCVMLIVIVMVMVLVDGIVVYFVKEINKINMVLIGVGVVVIVVLLVVVGFFVYKYCVMKYCYYILMVRNKLMSWLE